MQRHNSKSEGIESTLSASRQRGVRKFAADYFHRQLMQNPSALHHQMEKRGHSLEVLQHFKVGMAGGDLIGQATKNGFSVEELVAVGLVKKNKIGYRPYIPNGHFVYPHWSRGEVLFFSIKDPTGKKKFQIPKKFADPDWVCMNQDALGEDVISIVEGENDLLSIVGKAKQPDVLATIGNHNTPNILKHLTQNSAGKTFRLVFDRDEAGEKYTSKYADAIKKGGGKVYKINIPPPHNDIDEFLRKADNPVEAFNRLIENATLLNPVEITDERPILERFNSFQVLGELADERIAFWSRVSKKLYRVSIRDLNLDKLDQIGGEEVIAHVSRKPQDGKITFRTLKRAIIVAASQKQLGNPEYVGQGIHLVGPDKLLIINGADAWIWDGKKGARHESPVV